MDVRLPVFEGAFGVANLGVIDQHTCHCGTRYYDASSTSAPGVGGVAVQRPIGIVAFNGTKYTNACSCWHPDAIAVMDWVPDNVKAIIQYFEQKAVSVASLSPINTANRKIIDSSPITDREKRMAECVLIAINTLSVSGSGLIVMNGIAQHWKHHFADALGSLPGFTLGGVGVPEAADQAGGATYKI